MSTCKNDFSFKLWKRNNENCTFFFISFLFSLEKPTNAHRKRTRTKTHFSSSQIQSQRNKMNECNSPLKKIKLLARKKKIESFKKSLLFSSFLFLFQEENQKTRPRTEHQRTNVS